MEIKLGALIVISNCYYWDEVY